MQNQTTLPATPVHGIVTMPFAPYYEEDGITIYNADCRQVLPFVGRMDLLLTDPPYGIDIAKSGKVGGSNNAKAKDYGASDWDKEPPRRWFLEAAKEKAERAILWGGNYYEGLPPSRCWLVWHKNDTACNFADCELAWTNIPGGVKYKRHLWNGYWQEDMGNKEARVHPTQKPTALMRWCLSLVPEAQTVLDPFMGSGTTLVAARLEGRKAIGIEISERYCEAAVKRLAQKTLFWVMVTPRLTRADN
jgi:DNA modification methylase